jgi:quercetin dioxygenase-like cupin family protein
MEVSEKYTPDDSAIHAEKGKERIRRALEEHRSKHGEMSGVITSRDPGMNDLLYSLRRGDMPPGFEQQQLPVSLKGPDVLFYLTTVDPGAIVPGHRHERDLWRVIVSGSIILDDGRELRSGDWMYVPAGADYSFRAGLNPGAIIYHCYG